MTLRIRYKHEKSGIYSITCKVNDYQYIGYTSRAFSIRWNQHFYELKYQKHPNHFLQTDFDKYGKENFECKILEVTEDQSRENYWIDKFKESGIYNIQIPSQVVDTYQLSKLPTVLEYELIFNGHMAKMGPSAFAVYVCLLALVDSDISYQVLANLTGQSRHSVIRRMETLINLGYIKKTSHVNNGQFIANSYELLGISSNE